MTAVLKLQLNPHLCAFARYVIRLLRCVKTLTLLGYWSVTGRLLVGYWSVNVERGLVSMLIEIIEAQLFDWAIVLVRHASAQNPNSPAVTQRGSFRFIESCHTLVSLS